MAAKSWTSTGFWLALGLAGGMLIADLTNVPTLEAGANTSRYKEDAIVAGASNNGDIDYIWLLDYGLATVQCISMNRNGTLGGLAAFDLTEPLKEELAAGEPHFMMITGKFVAQEIADVLYLFETNSHQVLVIAAPIRIDPNGVPLSSPRLLAKFSYR